MKMESLFLLKPVTKCAKAKGSGLALLKEGRKGLSCPTSQISPRLRKCTTKEQVSQSWLEAGSLCSVLAAQTSAAGPDPQESLK